MWFLGVDIGSGYSKAVVCEGQVMRSFAVLPSGGSYEVTGRKVIGMACEKAGISHGDISRTVATGYGSAALDFVDEAVTDIVCHAAGIYHMFPSVRTFVDIGAQFSKAVRVNDLGKIAYFVMNEKCAGGSGKFLQVVARILHRKVEDIAEVDTAGSKVVEFTTGCAVFAESEAVSRIAEGALPDEILAGVHKAMASKISNLLTRVGLTPDCAITGGGARHRGLVEAVKREIALPVLVPDEPQITGALGAALIAGQSAS